MDNDLTRDSAETVTVNYDSNPVLLDHVTVLKDATLIVNWQPQASNENDFVENEEYSGIKCEIGESVHQTVNGDDAKANCPIAGGIDGAMENAKQEAVQSSKSSDPSRAALNNDINDLQKKEREDRIRAARERQASEYRRKVGEMQEAMTHAQEVRKKQEQERRRRMEEMKRREDEHRTLVEERRKKLLDEENERRQAIMRRAAERYSKLNHLRAKRTYVWPGMFSPHNTGPRSVDSSDNSLSVGGVAMPGSESLSHQRSVSTGNVGHYAYTRPLGGRGRAHDDKGKSCRSESLLSSPSGTPTRRPHSVTGGRVPTDSMTNSFMTGRLPNYASPTVASQLRDGRTTEPHCHVGCSRYRSVSPEHMTIKNTEVRRSTDQWSIGYKPPDQLISARNHPPNQSTSADISHSKRTAGRLARTPDGGIKDPEVISRKNKTRASSTPVKLRNSLRGVSPRRTPRGESQAPTTTRTPISIPGKSNPANNKRKSNIPSNNIVHSEAGFASSRGSEISRSMNVSRSTKSMDNHSNLTYSSMTKISPRSHFASMGRAGIASPSEDELPLATSSPRVTPVTARPAVPRSLPKDSNVDRSNVGKTRKEVVDSNKKFTPDDDLKITDKVFAKTNGTGSDAVVNSPSTEKTSEGKGKRQMNEVLSNAPATGKSDGIKSQEEEYKLRLAEKRRLAREKAEKAAEEDAKNKEQDLGNRKEEKNLVKQELEKEQGPKEALKIDHQSEVGIDPLSTFASPSNIPSSERSDILNLPNSDLNHFEDELIHSLTHVNDTEKDIYLSEKKEFPHSHETPAELHNPVSERTKEDDGSHSIGKGADTLIHSDTLQSSGVVLSEDSTRLSAHVVKKLNAEPLNKTVTENEEQSVLTASKLETERNLKLEVEEKARQERAEKVKREEEERLERKKRLEMIMKRVKPDDTNSKSDIVTSASPHSSIVQSHSGADLSEMLPEEEIISTAVPVTTTTEPSQFRSPLLKQLMSNKARVPSPVRYETPTPSSVLDKIEGSLDSNTVDFSNGVERSKNSSSTSKILIADGVRDEKCMNLSVTGHGLDMSNGLGEELINISENSVASQSATNTTTAPDWLERNVFNQYEDDLDISLPAQPIHSVDNDADVISMLKNASDDVGGHIEQGVNGYDDEASNGLHEVAETGFIGSRKECFVDEAFNGGSHLGETQESSDFSQYSGIPLVSNNILNDHDDVSRLFTKSTVEKNEVNDLIDDNESAPSIGTMPLIAFEDKRIRVGPIPDVIL